MKAVNVQYAWGEHGPSSANFEVPVDNAYREPPAGLYEGAWVELYDGGHLCWDGEIASIKPNVVNGQHRLMVECGGLLTAASKRGDLVQTWSHRGVERWKRRPGSSQAGDFITDKGDLTLSFDLSANIPDISSTGITNQFSVIWTLDDLSTSRCISAATWWAAWDVQVSGSLSWDWFMYSAPDLVNYTECDHQGSGTGSPVSAGYGGEWNVRTFNPMTRVVLCMLRCNNQAAQNPLKRYFTWFKPTFFSSLKQWYTRIDEAMLELATGPGLALTGTNVRVGTEPYDLHVGEQNAPTNVADALETLEKRHSTRFRWAFGLRRTFDVRPGIFNTPDNDNKVVMLGRDFPGLDSWDVAEYDEDSAQFAKVLFGNKDNANCPEGWLRSVYRPYEPTDNNLRVKTIDLSPHIMTDKSALAVADYVVETNPLPIPPDYAFRAHAQLARGGKWPNEKTNVTTRAQWQEIGPTRTLGSLVNFWFDSNDGWTGSNAPMDPSCLQFEGSRSSYVNFGNMTSLNRGSAARTISAWVCTGSAFGADRVIFSKWSSGQQGFMLYQHNSGAFCWQCAQDGVSNYHWAISNTVSASTWYHVVGTWDGTQTWMSVNGVSNTANRGGTQGAWNMDNTANVTIGARAYTPDLFFNGNVGDIMIYNRLLSSDEIAQLYNAGPCLYDRSLARGTAVVRGKLKTRTGALVKATHVTPYDWWVQNPDVGRGRPLQVTGTNVNMAEGINNLTIGTDWVYDEIGVARAELLALEPTPEPVDTETPEPNPDWSGWV